MIVFRAHLQFTLINFTQLYQKDLCKRLTMEDVVMCNCIKQGQNTGKEEWMVMKFICLAWLKQVNYTQLFLCYIYIYIWFMVSSSQHLPPCIFSRLMEMPWKKLSSNVMSPHQFVRTDRNFIRLDVFRRIIWYQICGGSRIYVFLASILRAYIFIIKKFKEILIFN